jgi:two-component system, OmpR family, alkaline phosphatase synthesis response regulator PhoP
MQGDQKMPLKRILVVDDEPEIVRAIQIRLQHADYEVIVACDGLQALEVATKENPDLIVLDLMLPKMDGYKVCGLLKADRRHNKIPIILLTALAQESDREMSKKVGADAYITKPFEHQLLLDKIKELLKT